MPIRERLVLAMTAVTASTAACEDHGDDAMFAVLARYYALAGEATAAAGGRVIKVMGDAVLMAFPPTRVRDAVDALRSFRDRASTVVRGFDPRCAVQLKIAVGTVTAGPLGPPGGERFDLVGTALNRLFKEPWRDVAVSREVEELLEGRP